MYKWRDDVLLINNPEWFVEDQFPVANRWLARLLGSKESPPAITDLVEVNWRITSAQAQWMGERYGLTRLRRLDPLLRYAYEHRGIMSADGVQIGRDDLPLLRDLFFLQQDIRVDRAARVRLVCEAIPGFGPDISRLKVELYDPTKRQWGVSTVQNLKSMY